MGARSLKACGEGIQKALNAITAEKWSQEDLANELKISRQPVTKFFGGKEVDRKIFVSICEILKLDWQEISNEQSASPNESLTETINIDELVRTARSVFIR
jgi:transcriptional regulator with XRE-family HTH domain